MGAWASSVESVTRVLSQSGITWGGCKLAAFFLGEIDWCAAWRDAMSGGVALRD